MSLIIDKFVNNGAMRKVLFVFQLILKLFLIYIFFFIWARYFIRSLWLSLLVSAAATTAAQLLSIFLRGKKTRLSTLKIKEKEDAENMFLSLATSSSPIAFFDKLTRSRHPSTTKRSKYILINHSEKSRTILYPFLQFRDFEKDDLTQIITTAKKENATKLVVPCGQVSKDAFAFAKNFELPIVILDKFETYKRLYKEYAVYPEITMIYKKDKALAFRDLLAYSFNKGRTKGYLLSALVLFFAGFIVRANLYYSIMASILVVFAFVSQLNTTFNHSGSGEVL